MAVGKRDIMNVLLAAGADPNVVCIRYHKPEVSGKTALHGAAHEGDMDSVLQLLAAGADACAKSLYGLTALHYAFQSIEYCGSIDDKNMAFLFTLFIRAGHPVNAPSGQTSLLHMSVKQRYTESIRVLLQHGADVSAVDEYGKTSHQYAVAMGYATGTMSCQTILPALEPVPKMSVAAVAAVSDRVGRCDGQQKRSLHTSSVWRNCSIPVILGHHVTPSGPGAVRTMHLAVQKAIPQVKCDCMCSVLMLC